MKIDENLLETIRQDFLKNKIVSTPYLQRKYKMGASMAKYICEMIDNPIPRNVRNGYRKLADKLIVKMFSTT